MGTFFVLSEGQQIFGSDFALSLSELPMLRYYPFCNFNISLIFCFFNPQYLTKIRFIICANPITYFIYSVLLKKRTFLHKKTPHGRTQKPYKWEITLDRMHLSPAPSQGLFLWTLKVCHFSTSLSSDTEAFVSLSISSVVCSALLLTALFLELFLTKVTRSPFWKPFVNEFSNC